MLYGQKTKVQKLHDAIDAAARFAGGVKSAWQRNEGFDRLVLVHVGVVFIVFPPALIARLFF